jgi:hypothetical protein
MAVEGEQPQKGLAYGDLEVLWNHHKRIQGVKSRLIAFGLHFMHVSLSYYMYMTCPHFSHLFKKQPINGA